MLPRRRDGRRSDAPWDYWVDEAYYTTSDASRQGEDARGASARRARQARARDDLDNRFDRAHLVRGSLVFLQFGAKELPQWCASPLSTVSPPAQNSKPAYT